MSDSRIIPESVLNDSALSRSRSRRRMRSAGHLASHSQLVGATDAPTTPHLEQHPSMRCDTKPRHKVARIIEGSYMALPLPLCWDADAIHRHGADYDTDDWFTAWDLDAIDPTELVFATADEHITCPDCLEWIHA